MRSKSEVNVFWFKRDLRLIDNPALQAAIDAKEPTILLYVFEPEMMIDEHYTERDWNFVQQSLIHLNNTLEKFETKIHVLFGDFIEILETISEQYIIKALYSHQETGLLRTYKRDKKVLEHCKKNKIKWNEFEHNGVIRGLKNRQTWRKLWLEYMSIPIQPFKGKKINF